MELIGDISSIIYKNEENNYTIATVIVEQLSETPLELGYNILGLETTVVGYLPFIDRGEKVKFIGRFVIHPDYGDQFKADGFEKIIPKTLDALEKYLSNGSIKGIGTSIAKRIIKHFGEDTINIIKNEPEKLVEIKGITIDRAEEICEKFTENFESWQIVGFLQKFGIGPQNAQAVVKKFGGNTMKIIEDNPYVLCDMGFKVNFSEVDRVALSIGFAKNNLERISAGILHALRLIGYNGHTCTLEKGLIKYVCESLNVQIEDVGNGLKDLLSREKISIEKRAIEKDNNIEVGIYVYINEYYKIEEKVANKLKNLMSAKNTKKLHNVEKLVKELSDIELSDKQLEAIKMVSKENVVIITGGPGTGKTTIIKTIIDIYSSLNKKIVLCAPTGRAAKKMSEATGMEASTLHRLLEIGKIADSDTPNTGIEVMPIDADILIVDEVSMVDIILMNYLLKGVYNGTKLILIGDSDQLPSVGPGDVIKNLIDSEEIPTIKLNKIFRQAAKSQIIVNARKVNDGILFYDEKISEDSLNDFQFIKSNNVKEVIDIIVKLYDGNTEIITPTKRGELGTKSLNRIIQAKFNPEAKNKNEKNFGEVVFREADKVMQIKNNYDIEWVRDGEHSTGIFNGEMGIIQSIKDGVIEIHFDDDKIAKYNFQDMDQIEHCYAITVHKSQGSEFDKVLMPILNVQPMLLTRNVLYTGMTRAKKMLTIIGSEYNVSYMIKNVNIKKRNTGLEYKLRKGDSIKL
mgnify:CR=1 FL=1